MSQVLPGVLTLTTDFGYRDHYVGAMKGVVASLAPGVQVFDITHEVPSFDIAEGAFAIAQAWRSYPDGTVHVVVVDPGVGSSRAPIAAAAGRHFFRCTGQRSAVAGLGVGRDVHRPPGRSPARSAGDQPHVPRARPVRPGRG